MLRRPFLWSRQAPSEVSKASDRAERQGAASALAFHLNLVQTEMINVADICFGQRIICRLKPIVNFRAKDAGLLCALRQTFGVAKCSSILQKSEPASTEMNSRRQFSGVIMFRRGLVLYLSFVLAAGPCFCCCTISRLADQIRSFARSTEHKTAICPYCGCCSQDAEESTENDVKKPSPKRPRSCPCREQRQGAVVDVSAHVTHARILQDGWQTCCSWLPPNAPETGQSTPAETNASTLGRWSCFAHMPCQKALSTLQVFLC